MTKRESLYTVMMSDEPFKSASLDYSFIIEEFVLTLTKLDGSKVSFDIGGFDKLKDLVEFNRNWNNKGANK